MIIKNASYLTSSVSKETIIKDGKEFAFVGRSNVGKSSFINSLVGQKGLCKTSSTPGRTRMINYFSINSGEFRFVDLPGYGYAQAGGKNLDLWSSLMEEYFLKNKALKRVFFLIDIRINPTEQDKQMLKYLSYNGLPFTIVATKADKLPKSKIANFINACAKTLQIGSGNIIAYSSETAFNKDKILEIIGNDLNSSI